jgi:putative copper export protein
MRGVPGNLAPLLVDVADAAAIRRPIARELVLAAAVLLVTAFLVATPPPAES